MNEEKMSTQGDHEEITNGSDEWNSDVTDVRQRLSKKTEAVFAVLKERLEKKVDELTQSFEDKVMISVERLLRDIENRISSRTSAVFERADNDSQIPLKKRKLYLISIDDADNVHIPSTDGLDGREQRGSETLEQRVQVLETTVKKLVQEVLPQTDTNLQRPDSSKSPNTLTLAPSVSYERLSPTRSIPTSSTRASLARVSPFVQGDNGSHEVQERLKEGIFSMPNVKQNHTFIPAPLVALSSTAANDGSTSHIQERILQEVTRNDKNTQKHYSDSFKQYGVPGEKKGNDVVQKELMNTVCDTITSKCGEKSKENLTGYTEMLDFHSAIAGYTSHSITIKHINSCLEHRPHSYTSFPSTFSENTSGEDISNEGSPFTDDTFPMMVDLSSEVVTPSTSTVKSPVLEPSNGSLPNNSYIVVKVLSDGNTAGATEPSGIPIKEMILPIFDDPKTSTKISTVSNPQPSPTGDNFVCIPPSVPTQTHMKTNRKVEGRSNEESSSGSRTKFRVPMRTTSLDYYHSSSTNDIMSSIPSGAPTSDVLKSVVEKLVDDPRLLHDENVSFKTFPSAFHFRDTTAFRVPTQQWKIPLASTCKTPFEMQGVQSTERTPSANGSSSSTSSSSQTLSQPPPLRVSDPTIELRDDQSGALSDSSQSTVPHRPAPMTSPASSPSSDLESTRSAGVDHATAHSDSSRSSTPHRPRTPTAPPPPTSPPPRVLESIVERRVDQSRALRYSAAEGRLDALRRLLAEGTDPDARDAEGCTALHRAARRGMWLAVDALLVAGADYNAKDRVGWTAMHCAAAYDPAGLCVTLLAKAGASVNARSNSKSTPLHLAARYNNEKAIRALLEAGASKAMVDAHGRMPIHSTLSDAVKNMLR